MTMLWSLSRRHYIAAACQKMAQMPQRLCEAVESSEGESGRLGEILREGWEMKKKLSSGITNPALDSIYERAVDQGATGGKVVGAGGWGPEVRAKKLERGQGGDQVVALRNRLIRMGYLKRTAKPVYDDAMVQAVARFQRQLRAMGVVDALREAGVQTGDTVYIGEQELEWSE